MFALFSLIISFSFAKNHGNGINIDKSQYRQSSSWKIIPDVIICYDSPFSRKKVKSALKIWEKEGNKSGNIVVEKYRGQYCTVDSSELYGVIQVKGYRNSYDKEKYYAWTWRTKSGQNLKGASIEFSPDVTNQYYNTLVHEFGHAFGYLHCNKHNDIMNP